MYTLPRNVKDEFLWWFTNLTNAKLLFKTKRQISDRDTDGWTTGRGAVSNGKRTYGFWTEAEIHCHISLLELLAAFYGLKCSASDLNNCHILLRLDNTTAISYIYRRGGIKI